MLFLQLLLVFLFISGISFLGSLQAGLVNVAVIQTALTRGKKAALWVAVGGSLPELLYAGLAAVAGEAVSRYAWLSRYLDYGSIAVFFVMGLGMLFQKPKPIALHPPNDSKNKQQLGKGLLLGLVNPQLFPFWFGVYVYTNRTLFPLQNLVFQVSFMTGAAFGAWLLLSLLARYVAGYQAFILRWMGHRGLIQGLGCVFIGLAAWKIIFILLSTAHGSHS